MKNQKNKTSVLFAKIKFTQSDLNLYLRDTKKQKMKKILFASSIIAFASCTNTKEVKKDDIKHLAGFWEISSVSTESNETINYEVNEFVDYFQLENDQGFRQKVSPNLDGSFQSNSMKEDFTVVDSLGTFYIKYQTPFNQWKEEIIKIDSLNFTVKNEMGNTYFYKKFHPKNK